MLHSIFMCNNINTATQSMAHILPGFLFAQSPCGVLVNCSPRYSTEIKSAAHADDINWEAGLVKAVRGN